MKRYFFTRKGEFRLFWLYFLCVILHGMAANRYLPTLEVIWDMVFYKSLAFGLHHISSFDLHRHFPVPPLYPLMLSPAFFASDYLTVEWIQSWINPLLYFLGIFPTYYYARQLLDPVKSAWVCCFYVVYPSAVYSQWSMSENLAVPLVMWVMALSVRLLADEEPRMREGVWLGIAIACVALTRIFLIVFCVSVLGWIAYRTWRRKRYLAPIWMAFSLSGTILITVWWQMGYLTNQGHSMVYADFNHHPFASIFQQFLIIFAAHWTGLWLEGGMMVTAFMVMQWFRSWSSPRKMDCAMHETVQMVFLTALVFTVAVAGYYVKRMGIEPWSVSLRYIFYTNLISLPIAVGYLGSLREASWGKRGGFVLALAMLLGLFGIGFLLPEAWQKFYDNHDFFSNAPSLDFLYQMRNEGPWNVFGFFFALSWLVGILALFFRRVGMVLLVGLLLYIQLAALGHIQFGRNRILQEWRVAGLHDFCREKQSGRWQDLTIYCEESANAPFLVPNLVYWIQTPAGNLLPSDPQPAPPYLLLTYEIHQDGKSVFDQDGLRAYLFEKSEQKNPGSM